MQKNAIARTHAPARKEFRTPNKTLYGRNCGPRGYAVFSYGEHFPLFVWDGEQWFANADKYSNTTSHHFGQCGISEYKESTTDRLRTRVRALDAETFIRGSVGDPAYDAEMRAL